MNITEWFSKPKPDPLPAPKQPSGERLKVLHVSDLHIDPRRLFYSCGLFPLRLIDLQDLLMARRQTVPADSVAAKMLTTNIARRHHYYRPLDSVISCGMCTTASCIR